MAIRTTPDANIQSAPNNLITLGLFSTNDRIKRYEPSYRSDNPANFAIEYLNAKDTLGVLPNLLFINTDGWTRLFSRIAEFGNSFEPEIKYDMLTLGRVGCLMGVNVVTDAFLTYDKKRTLRVFFAYI